MKLKIIFYSLYSLSLIASERSVQLEPKSIRIETVFVAIGRMRLERPVTPKKTKVEEIQLEENEWSKQPEVLQQGPIRRSLLATKQLFEVRKNQAIFEDKVKMDMYEIARAKYLKNLEQLMQAHFIVSSAALSDNQPE